VVLLAVELIFTIIHLIYSMSFFSTFSLAYAVFKVYCFICVYSLYQEMLLQDVQGYSHQNAVTQGYSQCYEPEDFNPTPSAPANYQANDFQGS